MPIAVSPIDGEIRAMLSKFVFDGRDQFARLLVDWALAIEVVLVFGNREQAFARNIASAEDVFEEGNDIAVTFRTAERNHQECVVVHGIASKMAEFWTKKHPAERGRSGL